ncbi:MAG: RNA polymerase subunit sigma [Cytophagaceae bacterium SCN 52-12]|nr:MAG: RNA polymerase subunit sigma [Cytophagaceae bacterium SCN 52-12]
MTTVLCRHFGLKHIEIAEDIASETFLKASESWAIHGMPENPVAWLYTVANNKTRDYFRRIALFETEIRDVLKPETAAEDDFDYSDRRIADSQLAMIFAVCSPDYSIESQICLALQILCGFSIEEIASAFLSKPETVKKRLHRARTRLRNDNFQVRELSEPEIRSRLPTVLKTLYLLFNEGYFSKTNNLQIRKDLCSEAVRLALLLTENPLTSTPQANALLALMCYQSSRLDARIDPQGRVILFDEQDKTLWDHSLIAKGHYYLVNACTGDEVSRYHLEAGIAYWHTAPAGENKWQHILQLYDQLMLVEYAPVTVLSRVFAFSRVYGPEEGIREAGKLDLADNADYHALLGFLYAGTDACKAIAHYRQAIERSKSKAEKETLRREMERLRENNEPDHS